MQAALDWRNYMVSDYSDAGQEKWLTDRGIALVRGVGRLGRCLSDGSEVRGERLLVSTGRHPRVQGIGLETVGIEADPHGLRVDEYLRAGEKLWAIGDVNGIWPLTHVGEDEGDVVAANIAGDSHPVNYEAAPRVTYTDPQAAAVRAAEAGDPRHTRSRTAGGVERRYLAISEFLDHLRFGFQNPSNGDRQKYRSFTSDAGADGTAVTVEQHRR